MPFSDADAMPLGNACPWSISIHKFIHTFAKYNLQMPNTNAVPISIDVAVPVAVSEPMPMLCPWLMPMPSHC